MNSVQLVGRVARDPQLRKTANGKSYMFLSLAVSGYWDRRKKQEVTDFIPLVLWGKEAERCQYLVKGSLVSVVGRVGVSDYQDPKTGERKFSVEIVGERVEFLSKPRSAVGAGEQ